MRLNHYFSPTAAPISANVVSLERSWPVTNYWGVEFFWEVEVSLQGRGFECEKLRKIIISTIVRFYGKKHQALEYCLQEVAPEAKFPAILRQKATIGWNSIASCTTSCIPCKEAQKSPSSMAGKRSESKFWSEYQFQLRVTMVGAVWIEVGHISIWSKASDCRRHCKKPAIMVLL